MDAEKIVQLTGTGVGYRYNELTTVPDEHLDKYIRTMRQLCGRLASHFDATQNTEWFIRSYLALKFILGATVMATSARFAERSNLKVTLPYLNYYMMLNSCRAYILTHPCLSWQGENTIEMTHSAILKTAIEKLKRLGAQESVELGQLLWNAKSQRELLSYRFPSSGLAVFGSELVSVERAVSVARFFTELSQVNLTCLEAATRKKARSYALLELEQVWHTMRYPAEQGELVDDEDYYRVSHFYRKYRAPVALVVLAKEGLVDDFFGAWADEQERPGYDPDVDYNLLLDLL